ncbi:hypothetical protein HPP92_001190 [Vanilla planifolia]|uniref:Uncharacterized protein n=1 Tax=Vanilla planifolia TaxID=51239 RepID=A0A835RVT8_VANPL|nr:hypothetical protein HPP92_001190 [Vanilla planifolia]
MEEDRNGGISMQTPQDSITINSPAQSPNTDGIHMANSNNVEVYNSVISTLTNISVSQHWELGPEENFGLRGECDREELGGEAFGQWGPNQDITGGQGSASGVIFDGIQMDTQALRQSEQRRQHIERAVLNINGTYDDRRPPIHLGCSEAVPCTNIALSNVKLLPAQGGRALDAFCWNAYGEMRTASVPPISCLLEGMPRSIPGYKQKSAFLAGIRYRRR